MAVVQISRIQIRRGKANSGTGFPQLASGELGWAIDTQELYIGNGSVSEGAPAVGNTKILTENDFKAQGNILNLLQHIYKVTDTTITTGPTANDPISRDLQERLDDRVISANFGTIADGITDDTAALQRAIDQLFLNPTTSAWESPAGVNSRVILELLPGTYKITDTLYIPSYATLVGAGPEKTIIEHTGTGPVIEFINDSSTIGNPSVIGSTTGLNQPKYITLSNLTVSTTTDNQAGLVLNSVKNSLFDKLVIKGNWANSYNAASIGVSMFANSEIVTSERNTFRDVTITGFSYGVFSKHDISFNTFDNCSFVDLRQGVVLGEGSIGSIVGQQLGPRTTQLTNCIFTNVKRQAVLVVTGAYNIVRDCKFINVGNDGGFDPLYPQVYFKVHGNYVQNFVSDRLASLSRNNLTVPYIPEVSGISLFDYNTTRKVSLGDANLDTFIFRLPLSVDAYGTPKGSISYTINYLYKSEINGFSRKGSLTVTFDIEEAKIQTTDDYTFTGVDANDTIALKLNLKAFVLASDGTIYGGLPQEPYAIGIYYTNDLPGDAGVFSYTYTAQLFDI